MQEGSGNVLLKTVLQTLKPLRMFNIIIWPKIKWALLIFKGIPASLRLSLELKLKEDENITEAKIKVKVAETIAKLKDIVNQKMVLIRTL